RASPPDIDASVAHIERAYDYWLGGKDNFAVDREAGDEAIRAYPDLVSYVRANRAFLTRTHTAATSRSHGSSTAWNSCRLASCPSRSGIPARRRRPAPPPCGAASS
ncbi:MAG TPA: SAM-dependent methyltransferase, partial [Streptosporangiaceae bacterium]|nr:SAM-dependent methyltransferase [Streptosporangiaceae bacterium]